MRRPRLILTIAIICFIAALFIAGLLVLREPQMPPPTDPPLLQSAQPPPPEPEPQPEPEPESESDPEPEPKREPEKIPLVVWPVRMYIPALALDTVIEDTGLDAGNTMEVVPDAEIISWLRVSAIPGNEGNAILAGHNKWRGKICPLYELDALEIGDEMEIEYEGGGRQKFRLESVFVYALATAPAELIMDACGAARVTVITCKAPFNPQTGTSDNRIVATFKEESVFVIPDPPIEPYPPIQRPGGR